MGAHPGGLFARDTPVDPYGEDLEFWSEVRDGQPRTTTSTSGSTTGCSNRPTRTSTSTGWARSASPGCGARADPDSWRDDEAAHPARPRRPARRLGVRRGLRRPVPRRPGRRPLGADAVLAGAGVANLAAWLAVGWPGPRVARWCSPPSSACGATSRPRPTPSSSTTAASRRPPCSATADQVLGMLVSRSGHHPARLPRRGPDRPARQHQLDGHPRQDLPGRLGRRQRRGLDRRRGRGDVDPHPAPDRRRGALHHLGRRAGARAGHRPRDFEKDEAASSC